MEDVPGSLVTVGGEQPPEVSAPKNGRVEGALPALEVAGIDPGLRPATLSELEYVRLANALVNLREAP